VTNPSTVQALRVAYIALDMALTGKPEGRCDHNWTLQYHEWENYKPGKDVAPNCIERLTGGVYYLSDGGYSRIGISPEDGHLFLSGVSRDLIKNLWNTTKIMLLRTDAEQVIRKFLREEGLL